MPQTEVLLVQHINSLGSEGDIVKVRPGYARNYLFPQRKAIPLSLSNKKRLESLKVARAARESSELQNAEEIAKKLKETKIAVAVKTGSGGKLFGSVTASEILVKLADNGFKLDKKHLVSFSPIKKLGVTKIQISLHKDVQAEIQIEVVSENPIDTPDSK